MKTRLLTIIIIGILSILIFSVLSSSIYNDVKIQEKMEIDIPDDAFGESAKIIHKTKKVSQK